MTLTPGDRAVRQLARVPVRSSLVRAFIEGHAARALDYRERAMQQREWAAAEEREDARDGRLVAAGIYEEHAEAAEMAARRWLA